MPCLHKFWLKEFFKLFFTIQLIILVLFILIEYLSMLDRFLNSDISLLKAFWFVLLEVPFMSVQITPAGVLLANIIVFSLMNRNNELLALQSSGVKPYSMLKPSLYSSALIMILMFSIGEILVPGAMSKAHNIEVNDINKSNNSMSDQKNIWIRSGKKIIRFECYHPATRSASGVTIMSMATSFKPKFRIDALKAYYNQGFWVLEDGTQQIYNKITDDYEVSNHKRLKLALDLKPEEIGQMIKKSEEMSFTELKNCVDRIEDEGYDATSYIVDLHGKIAFPFICIIMSLAGAVTGMKSFAKKSIPKAVTTGIVISFFYWVFYGMGTSLGYGKLLPPFIAAWITNLIFFTLFFTSSKVWD